MIRTIITATIIIVIGAVVLCALGYGLWFLLSPKTTIGPGDQRTIPNDQVWVCRGDFSVQPNDIVDGQSIQSTVALKALDGHASDPNYGEVVIAQPGAVLVSPYGGSCQSFAPSDTSGISIANENAISDQTEHGCISGCSAGVGNHTVTSG